MAINRTVVSVVSAGGLIFAGGLAWAAGQYGPGVSDTEIKLGSTMPYSGPASSYGTIGKSEAAYFAMINESSPRFFLDAPAALIRAHAVPSALRFYSALGFAGLATGGVVGAQRSDRGWTGRRRLLRFRKAAWSDATEAAAGCRGRISSRATTFLFGRVTPIQYQHSRTNR